MKKKILITLYREKCHSLYRQFIQCPPEGYEYLTLDDVTLEDIFLSEGNLFKGILNKIWRNRKIINLAKENNIDVIYCCDGILLFNSPIPWIVDLEHVTSFIAHRFSLWRFARHFLPLVLAQNNLKFIIPWTEAGKQSILKNLDLKSSIQRKILPIHLCLQNDPGGRFQKNGRQSPITLLFITSINYNSEQEFYSKGGKIVISVYQELKKKTLVKLLLRSKLPDQFDFLRKDPDVLIFEDILTGDAFESLFQQADVLVFPSFQSPGVAFLDAIARGLPIVATNVFANTEMISQGKTGFLIEFDSGSSVFNLEKRYGITLVPDGSFSRDELINQRMILDFSETILRLSEDRTLLSRMSLSSRRVFENKFTLEKRNKELKRIFDVALIKNLK